MNSYIYRKSLTQKNTEQMNAWLEKSTMTVAVLEQALQSILQG